MSLDRVHEKSVFLSRDPVTGEARTNVEHQVVRHSPTGLEFGYEGSGPSDLALNVLLRFVELPIADKVYQDFKREVIARVPREGGIITSSEIVLWLKNKGIEEFL